MDERGELGKALAELCGSPNVEVREDGQLLAELAGPQYEVQRRGHQVLIHLWSPERNLVRRVLRVAECLPGRLVLEVQRFGRSRPARLELLSPERARPEGRLTREKFRSRFRQLLAEQFPDEEVESLTTAPDLEHSFSGVYARGRMRRGRRAHAVMGVSAAEDSAVIEAMLTFGLVWLDWTRTQAQRVPVVGLRMFLPMGAGRVTAHRLQALTPSTNVELFEMDETLGRARPLDPRDIGNLATWLTPRREVEQTLARAQGVVEKIRALSPEAIDAFVPPGTRDVAFRLRGLEFARWQNGQVFFDPPEQRCRLDPHDWSPLEEHVRVLAACRHPRAHDTHHPLYRAQAERWLETLVLADPSGLDAQLDPQHIYSQVPAFSAGDRGVIDLLGVGRDGQLTVIELKVSEDIQLVLQAVDYWLRVRWHHSQGDFPRYGYFARRELQPRPPKLYLVAPGFRFHPATDTLLRYLNAEIEVVRFGLNENWRRSLQVVFRL